MSYVFSWEYEKNSPFGHLEHTLRPLEHALTADGPVGCTFVSRRVEQTPLHINHLLIISRMNFPNVFTQTHQLPNYQKQWLLEVEKCIIDQVHNPNLLVGDIAWTLGTSERQLYRMIKKTLGITPNALIQGIRLDIAKEYLEDGDYATVAEVSYAVGYKRSDYFSNLFAIRFKKRPIEFLQ